MVNVYWLRGQMGDAVWLWMALNGALQQPVNTENEWFVVLQPIGDGQIGQSLFADKETVLGWRDRLLSLGLIRIAPVPDKDPLGLPCHKYEVLNVSFGTPAAQTPLTTLPTVH